MNSAQRIYLVEDSVAIRQRLNALVGSLPSARVVGESGNASEAVVEILALRPDVVVLDLNLGDSNGMQVLRTVHPREPHIAFVVLTGNSESQYRSACQRAGASYFLDKSSEFESVRPVLAEIAATRH